MAVANNVVDMNHMVECRVCGHKSHSLYTHLSKEHGMSAADYAAKYPGAEVLSPFGWKVLEESKRKAGVSDVPYTRASVPSISTFGVGFGKSDGYTRDIQITSYAGFGREHGVPDVDPHYVFQAEISRDMLMGMAAGGKIYVSGPTGSGKTTWFEQYAARTGRPYFRQQFHQSMEPTELTGLWFVNEHGVMEFMYSGLAKALQSPSVIVLDEYDSGNPGVIAITNALLEGKPLVLANKGGEKVFPHEDCILVATGNTNGMGDDTGLYASTTVQSFATMNRFRMFVVIDYMEAKDEIRTISSRFPKIPKEVVADMVKLAGLVRNGFVGGKISVVLSTRQLINWGEWVSKTGELRRSFNLAFCNMLGGSDAKVVAELYQRVFGNDDVAV